MAPRREILAFCVVLAGGVVAFFHETLLGCKVLSPADVLLVSASFRDESAQDYEPANRLLMDPVLQFQPWLEFNRSMIRRGRLPLWNGYAGCGAPHLANGQSAVFDPFHILAYLAPTPAAYAWIAAGRLWVAGVGMFLLARSWGLAFWGRWFAGLVYPFCGFLVLWLLFPVTAVAIWMPWLFLATDRLFRAPGGRAAAWLAVVVALVIVGGHIQTSAHVLLAGGLYALANGWWLRRDETRMRRALTCWMCGICSGVALAAAQILPLACYLAKSPVWTEREHANPPAWVIARPRVLDAVCTAVPYAFGGQRRGQPNLAKALGVHNLNESAGGFAGLATLIWLAPLAVVTQRRSPQVAFSAGLALFGAMGAFRWPPVDNLLRAIPVLAVTDNRRLTLWVAFGLTLLGGVGLDQIGQSHRLARGWLALWVAGALVLASSACAIRLSGPWLRERSIRHYAEAARETPGALPQTFAQRAERQVRQTLHFIPRYHAAVALELTFLTGLAALLRRLGRCLAWIPPAMIALTLCDLAGLGASSNPAIELKLHEYTPPVIARLRQVLRPGSRCLGLGEELPPNVLSRFGLSDLRNYDSIELAASLEWLAPLLRPGNEPPSSRSAITWESAAAARDRLVSSAVDAIVASLPPPTAAFDRLEQAGNVWIAWLGGQSWATACSPQTRLEDRRDHGRARLDVDAPASDRILVRETWDPGWIATLDGARVPIEREWGVFMSVQLGPGRHKLILNYDPIEVRIGLAISIFSLFGLILVLTGIRLFWIPGITTRGGLDGARPRG
jgi:hypothetical protein